MGPDLELPVGVKDVHGDADTTGAGSRVRASNAEPASGNRLCGDRSTHRANHAIEPGGEAFAGAELAGPLGSREQRIEDDLAEHRGRRGVRRVRAGEVVPPRQKDERHEPERPDVGLGTDRRVHRRLLRRHPRRSPEDGGGRLRRVGERLRDAEVEQLDHEGQPDVPRSGQKHVRGLEVPMHDPRGVRRPEGVRDLAEHRDRGGPWERARTPQLARQRRAVEKLHDDVQRSGRRVLTRVHDLRDVVARERRREPRFEHEATAELVVGRELAVHHLERAEGARRDLLDLVDHSHAALGDGTDDAVGSAYDRARGERSALVHLHGFLTRWRHRGLWRWSWRVNERAERKVRQRATPVPSRSQESVSHSRWEGSLDLAALLPCSGVVLADRAFEQRLHGRELRDQFRRSAMSIEQETDRVVGEPDLAVLVLPGQRFQR